MRSFLTATVLFVSAAAIHAQTAPPPTTAEETAPPLIKTVADDPNDSPMVRAAKRAVKARQNAGQRRVVSLSSSSAAPRGRVAVSSGPADGPKLPPQPSDARAVTPQPEISPQEAVAKLLAEAREKLRQLQAEEQRIGTELDEPYGHDEDEDAVERRLAEIAAERKKLQELLAVSPPMR